MFAACAAGTVGVDMNVFGVRPIAPLPARGLRHTRYTSGFVAALLVGASSAASADCTPQAANGVTATCTGTTLRQGGGAPGTSASSNGYGTNAESGITVNVSAGAANTVTGNTYGIGVGDGTVSNGAGAGITGGFHGVFANLGAVDVTNSGSITGTLDTGIYARTSATVTNNAGASITGGNIGINVVIGGANVTNSGSITGTSDIGISANASATVTNNAGASITGRTYGIFSLSSGSSVFNAGSISGGVGAIWFTGARNTLTLAPGSAITGNVNGSGINTFQLGGSGAANFDVSQIGAAAQYRGFGTFNKIDNSVWTLTGTSSFAGPVNVNGGTLSVNGDISSASGVTVNTSGTLGGNGTVGTTTINGGTLSPGNSIGLLTVQGNLTFTAASSYMVEVSPTNADRVNVTGTATLGGATVNASFAPGSYVTRQYTIVNATGGVNGTFGSQVNTNLPTSFTSKLSYDANNAYLNLTLDYGSSTPSGSTPPDYRPLNANQQNVGNSLVGFFNRTGGIPLAFGALTPAGLSQASGEVATGAQQTTFDAMGQFMGLLTGSTAGCDECLRGAQGSGVLGYADEQQARGASSRRSANDAFAMLTKAKPARAFDPRWEMWAMGFGGSQSTDGNANVGNSATTSRIYGIAVGADYRLSPDTVAGFAMAGAGTNFSIANGGSGRSDLFQTGAFVRHTMGPAYVSAALAYGWQDITTERTLTVAGIDQLRARFNANAFSGRAETGYRLVAPWIGGVGITPYAAAQFTTFDLPAYAEQVVAGASTFALAYAAKSVTDTRSELGLRTDKSFALQDGALTLRGRLAWAHDYNRDRALAATFQALPGASFVVNGAAQAADSVLTTVSAEMKWKNGWSVAGTFEGEFSETTRSYGGKGVVRYAW